MDPHGPEALTPEEQAIIADLAAEIAAIPERYHILDYERKIEAAEERASARMRALHLDPPESGPLQQGHRRRAPEAPIP